MTPRVDANVANVVDVVSVVNVVNVVNIVNLPLVAMFSTGTKGNSMDQFETLWISLIALDLFVFHPHLEEEEEELN